VTLDVLDGPLRGVDGLDARDVVGVEAGDRTAVVERQGDSMKHVQIFITIWVVS